MPRSLQALEAAAWEPASGLDWALGWASAAVEVPDGALVSVEGLVGVSVWASVVEE